jgi:hypothetical protein
MTIHVETFGSEEECDATTGSEEEWDAFAATQKGYTHFHRLRWRTVMERVFDHQCVYLARDATNSWAFTARSSAQRGVRTLSRLDTIVNMAGDRTNTAIRRSDEAVAVARRDRVKLLGSAACR